MRFWKKKEKSKNEKKDTDVSLPPPENRTFKERVEYFWKWFSLVADDYFLAIETGNCADLATETSIQVRALMPSFAWVFGPGPEQKGGHSLTISGEGIVARQFLAEYWLAHAPDFEKWTFYAARQPGDISEGLEIGFGDDRFKFGELWVTPELDEENEAVNLTAWHPNFETCDEKTSDMALFIMLDEILGEHGTENWLGAIERDDRKLAGAIPVLELRDFLHDLEIERGWRKLPPTESFSTYQLHEPDDSHLRSDTIVGSTSCMRLVGDFLDNHGPVSDNPIADSGADFIFVMFPSSIAPEGKEVDFRGEIEDTFTAAFVGNAAGQVLGGATGMINTYIDMLIFDGDRSLEIVIQTMRDADLPAGSSLQFFCTGNEGRRIIL